MILWLSAAVVAGVAALLPRELWGWLPLMSRASIRLAAAVLPKELRALRGEEWLAQLPDFDDRRLTGLVWTIQLVPTSLWVRAAAPTRHPLLRLSLVPLGAAMTAAIILWSSDPASNWDGHTRIAGDGLALIPADAPSAIKDLLGAGNEIATKPYIYGGGHGEWNDAGYDCSGSVSYALHGAGLLDRSMASGDFQTWGEPGPGRWITIYANGGHMFMVVAGIRFDTSGRTRFGTRWQADLRSQQGYTIRHPAGL
jgi:hypothetical protein